MKKAVLLISFLVPIIFGNGVTAQSLDLKIKAVLRTTVGNVSGFKGAAVVDISSGDLMGYYIIDERLAEYRSSMAAAITNIVRGVKQAASHLGLTPQWFGIGLRGGNKMIIGLVDENTFVGSMYGKYAPIGAMKFQMRRCIRKIRNLLY